uniref:Uncharacterized protein n=1 Tax=Fusarium oxysporum (strain Fo5176) TaxID=660025 RepID=A0A0D2YCW8_FUSOF
MSSRLLGTSKIVSITSSFGSCNGLKRILPWAINPEQSYCAGAPYSSSGRRPYTRRQSRMPLLYGVYAHRVSVRVLFEIVLAFACLVMSVTTVANGRSRGSMARWPLSKQVLSMNCNSPSCAVGLDRVRERSMQFSGQALDSDYVPIPIDVPVIHVVPVVESVTSLMAMGS